MIEPFMLLVNDITFRDMERARGMLAAAGVTLRRTSTPESGPAEVLVEMVETDLSRVREIFREIGRPVIEVLKLEVE